MTTIGQVLRNGQTKPQASSPDYLPRTKPATTTGRDILSAYNPDRQRDLCRDHTGCVMGEHPTLARIGRDYGQNTATAWLIPQLYDLSEYCGCRDKLQGKPLEQCAAVIVAEFYFLKVSEVMLFFHLFKAGHYGKFYGSVDPMVITCALRDFLHDRADIMARAEQERREREEREYREAHPPVSYEEYLRRKEAAQ